MDIISYALAKGGIPKAVSDFLSEHLTNPTNPPIDTSLKVAGAAADAKRLEMQLILSDFILTKTENLLNREGVRHNGCCNDKPWRHYGVW